MGYSRAGSNPARSEPFASFDLSVYFHNEQFGSSVFLLSFYGCLLLRFEAMSMDASSLNGI